MSDEGELKEKIWSKSNVDTAEIRESAEYVAEARKQKRTDIVRIEDVFEVLDEAAKEFPLKEEQFMEFGEVNNYELWTIKPEEIMTWFKKWFGSSVLSQKTSD